MMERAALLLALSALASAETLYYVPMPGFQLTLTYPSNTTISLVDLEREMEPIIIEHVSTLAVGSTLPSELHELRLNVTEEQSETQPKPTDVVTFYFIGYAVFDDGQGLSDQVVTVADLYNSVMFPSFLQTDGIDMLNAALQAISTNASDIRVFLSDVGEFEDWSVYDVSLPNVDLTLKHSNQLELKELQDSLREVVETYLLRVSQENSDPADDTLYAIYLQGDLQAIPFDETSSLYVVNYTGSAIFLDDSFAPIDVSPNMIFEQVVREAFLSASGYQLLVEYLNETDAWNGLQGLKISVDNPYYEPPDPTSSASKGIIRFGAIATGLLLAFIVIS
jgi:hypothetical protein